MSDPTGQTIQLHLWIDRMRGGDDSAREELIHGICGRLEHLARKMLKEYPLVKQWVQTDDVLQSALLRVLRSLQESKPATTREFFNLACEHVRRELITLALHFSNRERRTEGGGLLPESGQHAKANNLDKWTVFHQEVERLPSEEREVVNLIFYQGWTRSDVAKLFQGDEKTVTRWWQSAMFKLHPHLKNLE